MDGMCFQHCWMISCLGCLRGSKCFLLIFVCKLFCSQQSAADEYVERMDKGMQCCGARPCPAVQHLRGGGRVGDNEVDVEGSMFRTSHWDVPIVGFLGPNYGFIPVARNDA